MTAERSMEIDAIPDALWERDQWVCWRAEQRDGKPTKVPVTPGEGSFASATDPETWSAFGPASDYVEEGDADGVGFVFTDNDPVVGVDLDDCRDPETGERDETAADIIDRLDSYTEVSPSGTGYHVLVEGNLPEGRNRKGDVECYDSARFFTVTGDHVAGTQAAVARRQDALVAIHREYVQEDDTASDVTSTDSGAGGGSALSSSTPDIDLDDEQLLEKAMAASNGEKFERLWNGNILGYDSQSEADMALCCLLAFWTGGDHAQMDRLFRQSSLIREKWDEVHYADGSTYGEKTIERAVATTSEFYDPDTSSGERSTDAAGSSSENSPDHAHLVEKTRLLRDRIDELEAALARKNDRIDELEQTCRALRDSATDTGQDPNHSSETGTDSDSDRDSASTSAWEHAKHLLRSPRE